MNSNCSKFNVSRILLNLGCGLVAPHRWRNYDASWHLYLSQYPNLDRLLCNIGLTSKSRWPSNVQYLNLNRPWDFPANSADVVYAHHVFEHLTQRSADLFLSEARRVLRAGGALRLVVPDLMQHAEQYLERLPIVHAEAAAQFLASLNLQMPRYSNVLRALYEQISGYPSMHKTMYDEPSLRQLLSSHGFGSIRREPRGQSSLVPEIADVEAGEFECSLYLDSVPL